jgi:sulfur-carrier protein
MQVTVRLFAGFRINRFKEETRQYDAPVTVKQVIAELGIPEAEVGIIFINGRNASIDQTLAEGDALSLFPLVGGG